MLLVFIYFYNLIVITINLLSFINIYFYLLKKKKKKKKKKLIIMVI